MATDRTQKLRDIPSRQATSSKCSICYIVMRMIVNSPARFGYASALPALITPVLFSMVPINPGCDWAV